MKLRIKLSRRQREFYLDFCFLPFYFITFVVWLETSTKLSVAARRRRRSSRTKPLPPTQKTVSNYFREKMPEFDHIVPHLLDKDEQSVRVQLDWPAIRQQVAPNESVTTMPFALPAVGGAASQWYLRIYPHGQANSESMLVVYLVMANAPGSGGAAAGGDDVGWPPSPPDDKAPEFLEPQRLKVRIEARLQNLYGYGSDVQHHERDHMFDWTQKMSRWTRHTFRLPRKNYGPYERESTMEILCVLQMAPAPRHQRWLADENSMLFGNNLGSVYQDNEKRSKKTFGKAEKKESKFFQIVGF